MVAVVVRVRRMGVGRGERFKVAEECTIDVESADGTCVTACGENWGVFMQGEGSHYACIDICMVISVFGRGWCWSCTGR